MGEILIGMTIVAAIAVVAVALWLMLWSSGR